MVGAPRSGTTFLAGALGAQPGLVDLGEVKPLKAAIPRLRRSLHRAAKRFRRTLDVVRTLGLAGHLRGVEQTPETSFVIEAALLAYPDARAVHIVRDGRDVVCSLLERGWLAADAERRRRRRARLRRACPLLGRARSAQRNSARRAKPAEPRGRGAATSPPRARRKSERTTPLRGARHEPGARRGKHRRVPRSGPGAAGSVVLERVRPLGGTAGNASWPSNEIKDVEEEAGDLLRELGYL